MDRTPGRATTRLGTSLALVGLLVGCQAPPPPAPAAAPAPPVEVGVVNFAFQPREVVVRVRQPVTWVLRQEGRHTVTAADGSFGSDILTGPGQRFTATPRKAGRVVYFCRFHGDAQGNFMAGVLDVRP